MPNNNTKRLIKAGWVKTKKGWLSPDTGIVFQRWVALAAISLEGK